MFFRINLYWLFEFPYWCYGFLSIDLHPMQIASIFPLGHKHFKQIRMMVSSRIQLARFVLSETRHQDIHKPILIPTLRLKHSTYNLKRLLHYPLSHLVQIATGLFSGVNFNSFVLVAWIFWLMLFLTVEDNSHNSNTFLKSIKCGKCLSVR